MILMGMLQFGVRQIAEVVAQMTSVERVLQYTHIQEEPGLDHGGNYLGSQYLQSTTIPRQINTRDIHIMIFQHKIFNTTPEPQQKSI